MIRFAPSNRSTRKPTCGTSGANSTPEEVARLLASAEKRTRPEHNLPGPDRAMIYRLALGTGFRASELRSLTPGIFRPRQRPAHGDGGGGTLETAAGGSAADPAGPGRPLAALAGRSARG